MKLRNKRTIIDSSGLLETPLTLWISIYNGTAHLSSLRTQLIDQTNQNFNLLVVDNGSTDDSWEILQEWEKFFKNRIVLVKNPINLQFIGSLQLNSDLVNSQWLLQIHQDDYYLKNHIEVHLNEIRKAPSDIIAISTDMGSMRDDGRKLPTLPRASWFPVGEDLPSQFIQNLISQSIPWPSTSFRTKEWLESFVPWHNLGFNDVEITLKILTKGRVKYVKKKTMLYRENPVSTSHSMSDVERKFSAAVSLTRVVSSNEFLKVAAEVEASDRDKFTQAIKRGIQQRVGESEIADFVYLMAAEALAFAWNYEVNTPIFKIHSDYSAIHSSSVVKLLEGIMSENDENFYPAPPPDVNKLYFMHIKETVSKNEKPRTRRALKLFLYRALIEPLPYTIKRFIVEKVLSLAIKMGVKHRWNFRWR